MPVPPPLHTSERLARFLTSNPVAQVPRWGAVGYVQSLTSTMQVYGGMRAEPLQWPLVPGCEQR